MRIVFRVVVGAPLVRFLLSIGAVCHDTDTQEPSFDTSTSAQGVDLGASVGDVVGVDGCVAGSRLNAREHASRVLIVRT